MIEWIKLNFRKVDIKMKRLIGTICGDSTARTWDKFEKQMHYLAYNKAMLCTEEKDINGKYIYEGDIIKHHFENVYGIVKFGKYNNICDDRHGGHIGFYIDWQDDFHKKATRKDILFWAKLGEVIGNIFENQELLLK